MVWYSSVVIFGVLIALGALFGWLTHVIGFNRLFLFFIIIAGGVSTLGIHMYSDSEKGVRVYIVVLLMIGASTVPAYAISDAPPSPDQIDEYQQFPQTLYFTGEFVSIHTNTGKIIGDLNTYQIVSTMSLTPTVADIKSFQEGDPPKDSIMVVRESNFKLYWGFTGSTGSFAFNPEDLSFKLSKNSVHKVYSNGNSYVYTRG
ncbi:hypothetical protein [Natronomonas marina]|uniref:hypothetical protein n=1 Tax=Natronomonas marina TaxID=2961939 RepID=UPI0020C9F000|nr:hypothetical protein [Natronomonas marina]